MPDQVSLEVAFSGLMQACFRVNRQLIAAAGQLTRDTGITGAQWGVLGVFGTTGGASLTVAQAARRLGQSRQSVQRVADLLVAKDLLEYRTNPQHRRAKLAVVTDSGQRLLAQLLERQTEWAGRAAGDLDIEKIRATTELVNQVSGRLVE